MTVLSNCACGKMVESGGVKGVGGFLEAILRGCYSVVCLEESNHVRGGGETAVVRDVFDWFVDVA